ncbi:MAG: efflux RND transporter periplasmic adaptor subunit [Haliea sp.]|uniref:efflux RND transporter periplasmic adaptor subunit n=1 Tax=Haliea sp. TaxID=1932666 RepID=UPI0032EDF095
MTFTITRALAPLLVIITGVAGYALLHATAPQPAQEEGRARPVSVFTAAVRSDNLTLEVTTQGEVRAATELDLVAQVGGRIVAVAPEFTEGGRITAGDALVTIEDVDYRLALSEARASVAAAEVRLQQARADAEVARKQLRDDPSASDLALKKPQLAEAHANLKAARARLEQAELNLERTRIDLPFNGRLLSTRVNIGQYVTPGSILGRAFATDRVEIRLPLSDDQLAALDLPIGYTADPGAARRVTLRASVAGRQHTWFGRLLRLDAAVDPGSRMLFAMAEVNDPYGSGASDHGMPLATGLFVEAVIPGRQLSQALLIPPAALRAGNKVHVVDADGRLQTRAVEVVSRGDEVVVIAAGLQAGEQVIVSTIRNPVQGMAVVAMSTAEAL